MEVVALTYQPPKSRFSQRRLQATADSIGRLNAAITLSQQFQHTLASA